MELTLSNTYLKNQAATVLTSSTVTGEFQRVLLESRLNRVGTRPKWRSMDWDPMILSPWVKRMTLLWTPQKQGKVSSSEDRLYMWNATARMWCQLGCNGEEFFWPASFRNNSFKMHTLCCRQCVCLVTQVLTPVAFTLCRCTQVYHQRPQEKGDSM